jgi:hypothetical protein
MKFPQLIVDQKEYETSLATLLEDPDCLLLFDTNILSQMYSLHADARAEFAAWLASRKTTPAKNRVVLPAWCLHEYTNKVIRNQLRDYIPVGASISATTSYSKQLMRHLAMSIDNKLAKGRNHDTRETYLQQLEQAHDAFIKLLPKPDNDEKTLNAIHEEITVMFGDSVAKSDIFTLLKTCQADYEIRYENNIPPGFLDAHKEKNKLGDYIIWREIMEIARLKGARSFVYISNDGKKDWVYSPSKVRLPNSEVVDNTVKRSGYLLHLIDPRLAHELSLAIEGEATIHLINFEQLVRQLTLQDELAFRQLAEAVQVNTERKARQKTTHIETSIKTGEAVQQPAVEAPVQTAPSPEAPNTTMPVTAAEQLLFVYADTALADDTYEVPTTSVGRIIDKLKSHNWHIQNAGIQEIEPELLDRATADELFVLGRNILQAAVGSSFRAEDYLQSFLYHSMYLDDLTAQHLFNGILYETYFDSYNQFRGSNGKAYYSDTFSIIIKNTPCLQECARFIQRQLQPFDEFVLFIPFVKEYRHEVVLFFRTPPSKEYADSILERCAIDGEVISTTAIGRTQIANHKHLRALGTYSSDLKHLMQAVCFSRYLPFNDDFVDVICKLDGKNVDEEDLGDYIVSTGLMV